MSSIKYPFQYVSIDSTIANWKTAYQIHKHFSQEYVSFIPENLA